MKSLRKARRGGAERPPHAARLPRVAGAAFERLDMGERRTKVPLPMVSATQQSSRIRHRKMNRPTASKRYNRAHQTPKFPVHPEGYSASAPDAKPTEEKK